MATQAVHGWPRGEGKIACFLRDNGLSIAAIVLFLVCFVGQACAGLAVANEEAREHGAAAITLFALFVASFALHVVGGTSKHNEDALRHGGEAVSALAYLGTAQFWFESFQNWQSEFLAVAVLVLVSIVTREKGSAQSKPVASPDRETGDG